MERVMVFGVFDGLHEGHQAFLRSAQEYGSLVVVVARDEAVRRLKEKNPRWTEQERVESIQRLFPLADVLLGDMQEGSYGVVKTHQPARICIGYDQDALERDLERAMGMGTIPRIAMVRLKPHQPEHYKSSLLA